MEGQGQRSVSANCGCDAGWNSAGESDSCILRSPEADGDVQHGVTSTNSLVDVVKFFSDHVFEDLQAAAGTVEPILQVDAIRYLYTFRNQVSFCQRSRLCQADADIQLTKEQLLSVLPLLVRHLGSENYVCYTYAAITIDRVLFIKKNNKLL